MRPNQYRTRLADIENKRAAARKMEILKLSHMSEQNPDYVLTRATGFTLFPEKMGGRRSGDDTEETGGAPKKPKKDPYVPI